LMRAWQDAVDGSVRRRRSVGGRPPVRNSSEDNRGVKRRTDRRRLCVGKAILDPAMVKPVITWGCLQAVNEIPETAVTSMASFYRRGAA
jgi:hypothetical protein